MGKKYVKVKNKITGETETILGFYNRLHPNIDGIESMFIRAIQDAFITELGYTPNIVKTDRYTEDKQNFTIQYWYNTETNKAYLEYELLIGLFNKVNKFGFSSLSCFCLSLSNTRFRNRVKNYLDNNFKYYLGIFPEIIFFEDNKNDKNWSGDLLTPFTIGYYKSLNGRYAFLSDKAKVIKDADYILHPPKNIIPGKTIQDWFRIVTNIRKRYTNNLTQEELKNFNEESLLVNEEYFSANNTYRLEYKNLLEYYGVDYFDEIPEEYKEEAQAKLDILIQTREEAEAKYEELCRFMGYPPEIAPKLELF